MTRLELLSLVVRRARSQGFDFRRWYTRGLGLPWISTEAALALLATQRRYYSLIFSHEFAKTFWKPGSEISFDVPSQTFQRVMPDGSTRIVHRKPFVRRTARPNAWRYHLRQMALAEEPLRYLRKYLHIEEDLDGQDKTEKKAAASRHADAAPQPASHAALPSFLQRPYRAVER